MRNFCHRQSFCEEVSDTIVKHLQGQFQNKDEVKMCFIQRTMHPIKRKNSGFTLTKAMVALLCSQLHIENDEEFRTRLESSLNAVVEESKSWKIEITSWHKDGENYEIYLNKAKCFGVVVKGILDFIHQGPAKPLTADRSIYNILCHVSTEPTLDDVRSLLYCSLLQLHWNPGSVVTLSSGGETDRQKFCDLLKAAHLDEKSYIFTKEETVDSNFIADGKLPKSFCDCLSRGSEEDFPHLTTLRRQDNRTAFQSKILCQYKNLSLRECMQKTTADRTVHVCSQKNQVLAQQSELFHAWCKDTISLCDNSSQGAESQCDAYLCHAGVQGSEKLDVVTYLEERKKQIKESFEAKLQVNLEGDDWNSLFGKMRAAMMKLEFFHHSVTSKMKLSIENDSLSTFATFILYNYSRLCMLLDSHSSKVDEGFYPAPCEFDEVEFSLLVEDAEWELLIDHLWNFCDVINKPLTCSQKWKVKIDCHQIVFYLHKLCRSVSAFYSRHHILGENFPHLLPMMNARIYLMKAAKKVMTELFNTLGVEPMTQM